MVLVPDAKVYLSEDYDQVLVHMRGIWLLCRPEGNPPLTCTSLWEFLETLRGDVGAYCQLRHPIEKLGITLSDLYEDNPERMMTTLQKAHDFLLRWKHEPKILQNCVEDLRALIAGIDGNTPIEVRQHLAESWGALESAV